MRMFRSFLVLAGFLAITALSFIPAAAVEYWPDGASLTISQSDEYVSPFQVLAVADDTIALREHLTASLPASTDDQMPYRLKPEYRASLISNGRSLADPHMRC